MFYAPCPVTVNGTRMVGVLRTVPTEETITTDDPEPDPLWQHTDSHGHYHARSHDPEHRYPTLRQTVERRPCDGTCGGVCEGEGYTVSRWHCRICGEEITPGTLTGPREVTVSEGMRWYVEVSRFPAGSAPAWLDVGWDDLFSVRLDQLDVTRFGLAHLGTVTLESDACSVELVGVGPLGTTPAHGTGDAAEHGR